MATAISPNNASATAPGARPASPAPAEKSAAQIATPAASPATLKPDTVRLSLSAQVRLLHHQGISPTLIAAQLGISVKQVGNFLPGGLAVASAKAADADAGQTAAGSSVAPAVQPASKTDAAPQAAPAPSPAALSKPALAPAE